MSDIERLSVAFRAVIAEWLTNDERQDIDDENAERDDSTCASHDYCDSNMAMWEAFMTTFGREPDLQSEFDTDTMNDAWTMAKQDGFADHTDERYEFGLRDME